MAIVQEASDSAGTGSHPATFASPVTVGNLIAAVVWGRDTPTATMDETGWTQLGSTVTTDATGDPDSIAVWGRIATATTQTWTEFFGDSKTRRIYLYEISAATFTGSTVVSLSRQTGGTTYDLGTLTSVPSGSTAIMALVWDHSNSKPAITPDAAWTADFYDGAYWVGPYNAHPLCWAGHATGAGANINPSVSGSLAGNPWAGIAVVFGAVAADVVADFIGTPESGAAPLTVVFTDQSTGGVDTWDWDFGDGSSHATTQNPTHVFTNPGSYDVTLIATRSGDSNSDSITKTSYVISVEQTAGVFMDWDGDGFATGANDDVSSDVISWTISRGSGPEITGGSQPGSATIVLKNSLAAGAPTEDRYNPRNASSPLYGTLTDGVPVWIGPNSDGKLAGTDARGLFGGRITDITLLPSEGPDAVPTVEIMCEDALGWYSRTPVVLDYAEGRSHGSLRAEALTAAGETDYSLAHEIQTMPLSHADGDLLSILDAINAINGTRHWDHPENLYTNWRTYTTRNRQWRLDATSDASLSASAQHVTGTDGWRLSADTVTNRQRATVTPIKFTPATFTVWQADTLPFDVTPDRPYSLIVSFDDVVSASFLNIASTGATIVSAYTPFASAGKIELSVASGTATVSALTVEGSLARRLEQQSYEANDTTSQALPRGIREGSEIGNEYLGVIASAQGIAEHVVWRYGNPQLRPTLTVENWFPTQFNLDLYDVIAFTSSQLGMTAQLFEIVGLTHTAIVASADVQYHTTRYVLQESRVQTDPHWFVLNTSELAAAGTDILGY